METVDDLCFFPSDSCGDCNYNLCPFSEGLSPDDKIVPRIPFGRYKSLPDNYDLDMFSSVPYPAPVTGDFFDYSLGFEYR
jgi:hypothetical protein